MKLRSISTLFVLVLCLGLSSTAANAKDQWLHVRSANFNLIGNASEKDIRRVAVKLEQFRGAFRLLFKSKLDAPIPTNVVVFKNDRAYRPFKPVRGDGKVDDGIAGYFQPGEDVNYITLAAGGPEADTFGTIFHEYVHFIVDTNIGKASIPAWFNEGLAEYYQTFEMEEDIKAKMGHPQSGHLALLRDSKLIPLAQFFNVSNAALLGSGGHSRSIFYAQAWATMHYLMANRKSEALDKFMTASLKGKVDESAFQEAFQMSYAQMESELRTYVSKGTYTMWVATFQKKLTVDADLTVSPLTEAESNAYLGDLLEHTNRPDDAEKYLQTALTQDPDSSMANTSMGMVKISQRKYSDAKTYLDRAIAKDPKNHLAYYQSAQLLSREGRDEFGYVSAFPSEKAARMRELLKKAIEINPSFTESYELMAFVSLVTNEGIDDAIQLMAKALKYQPGNQRYTLRIAELYLQQEKYAEAASLAGRIAKTTDDAAVRGQAESLLKRVSMNSEMAAKNEEARKKYEEAVKERSSNGPPRMGRRGGPQNELSPEEMKRRQAEFEVIGINRELRKVEPSEVRLLGKLEKVECRAGKITYTVTGDTETFTLTSKDFRALNLSSYVVDAGNAEIGCDAKVNVLNAVLTYKPAAGANAGPRGELVSIEFVPSHFQFVEVSAESAMPPPPPASMASTEGTLIVESRGNASVAMPAPQSFEEQRRAMLKHIRENLRKPGSGETRVLGFIEKSECNNKGMFFYVKATGQVLKLNGGTADSRPELKTFTPDVDNLQIGCGMKAVEVPVVITYRDAVDKKNKANGTLVSLEFVPKSFVLEQ